MAWILFLSGPPCRHGTSADFRAVATKVLFRAVAPSLSARQSPQRPQNALARRPRWADEGLSIETGQCAPCCSWGQSGGHGQLGMSIRPKLHDQAPPRRTASCRRPVRVITWCFERACSRSSAFLIRHFWEKIVDPVTRDAWNDVSKSRFFCAYLKYIYYIKY